MVCYAAGADTSFEDEDHVFLFLLFFFFLFKATPEAYGCCQANGHIRATASGLHHSDRGQIANLHPHGY